MNLQHIIAMVFIIMMVGTTVCAFAYACYKYTMHTLTCDEVVYVHAVPMIMCGTCYDIHHASDTHECGATH